MYYDHKGYNRLDVVPIRLYFANFQLVFSEVLCLSFGLASFNYFLSATAENHFGQQRTLATGKGFAIQSGATISG
jgi:hypothetical protein